MIRDLGIRGIYFQDMGITDHFFLGPRNKGSLILGMCE